MTMLLLLVRHGTTPLTGTRLIGRTPGVHLSEDGLGQAKAAAERLGTLPVKAVYSSPLERCFETAETIAARYGLEIQTRQDLLEVDYGDWTGRSFAQLHRLKAWGELQAYPADFRFPGGESIREAQTRVMGAMQALYAAHPKQAVAVVSHADIIRLTLAAYLGMGIDLYQRVIVGVASVSAVVLGDRVPRVIRMSDTGSLDELAERLKPRPAPAPATRRPHDGPRAHGS
jgi:probable phosphomutase (TIGR03848 family)